MQPYQQRVVDEHDELNTKVGKLTDFLESDQFDTVDPEEQHRLVQQLFVMELYLDILTQRVKAFNEA